MSIPNVEIPAAVQTAAIGRPHDPHLSTTLGRVESCRRSAQVHKDFLRDIFSFCAIAHDSKRDAQNQPLVTIQQDGYSVAVTCSEMLHDSIIGKIAELGVSQPARLLKMMVVCCHPSTCANTANRRPSGGRAYGIVNILRFLPAQRKNFDKIFPREWHKCRRSRVPADPQAPPLNRCRQAPDPSRLASLHVKAGLL